MVEEILLEGAENAQSSKRLCSILKIGPRELTAAVARERRAGAPICSNTHPPGGYYLAADKKEMQDFCSRLFHRAGEIHATRRACMKTVERLPDRGEANDMNEDTTPGAGTTGGRDSGDNGIELARVVDKIMNRSGEDTAEARVIEAQQEAQQQ